MKTGIKFGGFSVMNAGQKSSTINALPQLIANSTQGKFITIPRKVNETIVQMKVDHTIWIMYITIILLLLFILLLCIRGFLNHRKK